MHRFLILGLILLATPGCTTKKSDPAGAKPVIAVVPKGTTHEFWKSIHAGAMKAAQEAGVEILWKGPLKEDDREAQIAVVEDLVTRRVAGIVLAPLDDRALRAPVAGAKGAGIPTVIIDSDLQGDDFVSFVATDNYRGGVLAAHAMIELLRGTGRVVMLRYMEGSASTVQREKGFLDTIASAPGITVLSANQYGGATTESAYRASENLLAPYASAPGKPGVDGIFTPNESTTFGMLRTLQDGAMAGRVIFIGFDASPKLVEGLRSGEIHGLILQNPFAMGYLGVKTMVDHLAGTPVEHRVDTGVTLATRENMDRPEMAQLLHPDLSQWLK
jgi:ribose transport system substrate-binding protein